ATSLTEEPLTLQTRTCGPPPGPAPVTISPLPLPRTSPTATDTPPRNAGSYAMNSAILTTDPPRRLQTLTSGRSPAPAPVTSSGIPSPSTSPHATETAPGSVASNAAKSATIAGGAAITTGGV